MDTPLQKLLRSSISFFYCFLLRDNTICIIFKPELKERLKTQYILTSQLSLNTNTEKYFHVAQGK